MWKNRTGLRQSYSHMEESENPERKRIEKKHKAEAGSHKKIYENRYGLVYIKMNRISRYEL